MTRAEELSLIEAYIARRGVTRIECCEDVELHRQRIDLFATARKRGAAKGNRKSAERRIVGDTASPGTVADR